MAAFMSCKPSSKLCRSRAGQAQSAGDKRKTGENPDKKCRFFETQIRFKNLKSRSFE